MSSNFTERRAVRRARAAMMGALNLSLGRTAEVGCQDAEGAGVADEAAPAGGCGAKATPAACLELSEGRPLRRLPDSPLTLVHLPRVRAQARSAQRGPST